MKIKKTVSALLCFALLVLFTATPSQLTSSFSTRAASRPPVRGKQGMVSSVSGIASQVGVDVLKRGGNAVDAAVAVGLALAVVWPSA
ncbi:MAG TPA: gamma-glutamyltransferase, partial [Blastocatellia bacterium]|nr:gamma-glutamyltransferase [Blastocatellia bacterium]